MALNMDGATGMSDDPYRSAMLRLTLEMDQALGMTEAPWGAPPAKKGAARGDRSATAPDKIGDRRVTPPPITRRSDAPARVPAPSAVPTATPKVAAPSTVKVEDPMPVDLMRPKLSEPMPGPPADRAAALGQLALAAEKDLQRFVNDIATRVVFGEGDPNAALMFVGEGPGAEEDKQGRPFVGRSGQLLDKMIQAMGLSREAVYIGNVAKLRAADRDPETGRLKDRPPTDAEVKRGIAYLDAQIEIIAPKVIVTLGATALKYMIGRAENVTRVRGTWQMYRGIPLMPTYHPSFLLRAYTPENRAKVWDDLKQVMERLKS
ncbi:MAG: uracil-DNA glycosylase family protein [Phycisphaerae bacterium]